MSYVDKLLDKVILSLIAMHNWMFFGRAKTIPNKSQLPKVVVHKRNDEFRPIQVCPPFTESDKVAQCARDGALLMFVSSTIVCL